MRELQDFILKLDKNDVFETSNTFNLVEEEIFFYLRDIDRKFLDEIIAKLRQGIPQFRVQAFSSLPESRTPFFRVTMIDKEIKIHHDDIRFRDIQLVMKQTDNSFEKSLEALCKNEGDIVNAIMDLTL